MLYWEPWFQGDVARSVLPTGRNGGSLTLKGSGKKKMYVFFFLENIFVRVEKKLWDPVLLLPKNETSSMRTGSSASPGIYILSLDIGQCRCQKWLGKITRYLVVCASTYLTSWFQFLYGIPNCKVLHQGQNYQFRLLDMNVRYFTVDTKLLKGAKIYGH